MKETGVSYEKAEKPSLRKGRNQSPVAIPAEGHDLSTGMPLVLQPSSTGALTHFLFSFPNSWEVGVLG